MRGHLGKRKSLRLRASGLVAIVALLGAASALAVPNTLTEQGRLLDAGGAPVTGSVQITFTVYGDSLGSMALWRETQTLTLTDGYFSAELGRTTSLPATAFDGSVRYLGVTVDGDQEMKPLQALTSVPYAVRAETAENPEGVFVAGRQVVSPAGEWIGVPIAGNVAPPPAAVPGMPGTAGVAGPAGPAGPQGIPGPTGPQGAEGRPGPAGPAGAPGADGRAGPPGANGLQGPAGFAGSAGPPGGQGSPGAPGTPGRDGLVGPRGPTGPTGPAGGGGRPTPSSPQAVQGRPIPRLTSQDLVSNACAGTDVAVSCTCSGSRQAIQVSRFSLDSAARTCACTFFNSDPGRDDLIGTVNVHCLHFP